MKSYRPTSPSRRAMTTPDYKGLTKRPRIRTLSRKLHRVFGRAGGTITVRHKGGGQKRHLRVIDFKRDKMEIKGVVGSLEYDPNRTGFIALINYVDGDRRYIVAPHTLAVGDRVLSSQKQIDVKPGNAMPLKHMPVGTFVYNIELRPKKGGQLARSAGSAAMVLAHEGGFAQIKMPSSEVRMIPESCRAVVGQPSNIEWSLTNIGKAGRSRHMGIRPSVRGAAMNPVDHPHGGGEGRAPRGLKYPKTPWGRNARGVKSRNKKQPSQKLIISRRVK